MRKKLGRNEGDDVHSMATETTRKGELVSQNASLRSEPRAYDCDVLLSSREIPSRLRVIMSRRPLVLLTIVLTSLALSACSDASLTAPRSETADDATASCRSGTWTGSGRCGG